MQVPVNFVLLLATFLLVKCHQVEGLNAGEPNVCEKTIYFKTSRIVAYQQAYAHKTRFFIFSRYRTAYRTAYKQVYDTKSRTELHCCIGYYHSFERCKSLDCNSQKAHALGMESSAIRREQITVPGFAANDPKLDDLRFNIGAGLCILATQTQKTITIDFQSSGDAPAILSGIAVQLSKDWKTDDGYVKTYKMRYEDTSGNSDDFPGIHNGPPSPGIAADDYQKIDFKETSYKEMKKLHIEILEYDSPQQKICLRIELYGCQKGVCSPRCEHGGICIDEQTCKCPPNYGSSTTQCKYHFPDMEADPTITVLDDGKGHNEVKFMCNIPPIPNVMHVASWIIDGVTSTPFKTGSPDAGGTISELHQRELYKRTSKMTTLGLRCDVTACSAPPKGDCLVAHSAPRSSQALTPTVKAVSPTAMTLVEGDDSKDLLITLGGPPILFLDPFYADKLGTTDIRLEAQFDLNDKRYTCADVPVAVQKMPKEHCGPQVTSTNWGKPNTIKVKAVMDGLYIEATIKRKLHVVFKHIDINGNNRNADGALKLSDGSTAKVDVSVVNADGWGPLANRNTHQVVGSLCFSFNDPHMRTFDGLRYEAQYEGEFIAYRHKKHNVQVNSYFVNCGRAVGAWGGATCNCGVAVKVEDEVIVFSSCPRANSFEYSKVDRKRRTYFSAYMFLHDDKNTLGGKLPSGTRVYATNDGTTYFVYLPSGTYVKIMAETVVSHLTSRNLINFLIVPSVSDRDVSDGFCGRYDGNPTHPGDLLYPIGLTYPGNIHAHMKVWRENSCSLFHGTAKVTKPADVKIYCRCVLGSHTYDCAENNDADPCPPPNVAEVTADLIDNFSYKPSDNACTHIKERKKRHAYYHPEFRHVSKRAVVTGSPDEEDDVYLSYIFNASYVFEDPSWPTKSGWKQDKARTFCEDYLLNKDSVKYCKVFLGTTFDNEIENCIFDIKLTDGTTFSESTLKNIISQCLSAAEKFPPDVTTLPGGIKRTVLYDSLCLNNCNDNGICKNGVCVCNAGFYGSGCSLTKDNPPVISYISRDGLCNVRSRNCTRSEIFGTGYIKSTDLKCRITPYNPVTGVRNDKEQFTTSARYINFNLILCPHNGTNGTYLIAVSNNNGKDYSKDELFFMAYDSVCFKCSIDQEEKRGNCTQLSTGCAIGSGCYRPEEVDPKEKCNICDPSQNINEWSRNTANPNCPLGNNIAIIAGVTSALLVIIIITVAVVTHKYCRRKKKVSPSAEDIRKKVEQDEQNDTPGQTSRTTST